MTVLDDLRAVSAAALRLAADMIDGPEVRVCEYGEPVGGDGETPPTVFHHLADSLLWKIAAGVVYAYAALRQPGQNEVALAELANAMTDRAAQFEAVESEPDHPILVDDLSAHIFGSWHATGGSWSDVARELLADFRITKK